ncbi:MAG: hypothetical protein QGG72_01310 [Verrucomicrobiota bacterium]|jgi:hypothetical protein|nr:hypothetical protein [Verrucomicrobiota bacterium]
MKLQGKAYKFILLLLIAAFLLGTRYSQRTMNAFREKNNLTHTEPVENLPPTLALTTVVLGGFRGLIANVLWVRAMQMQEDGKFFEMAQLGDWITKLQPHADHVWRVTAWNMSYNISVKFDGIKTPHVRWHWVRRGIELIRDQGLKYNKHSAHLYHELAWHFQHKVGHNLDDAHRFYKMAWCAEMMNDPGPDGRSGTEDDIFEGGVIGGRRDGYLDLLDPQTDADRRRLKRLTEVFNMTPEKMKAVDDLWGPLEWRLPDAHAIYWAQQGINDVTKRFDVTGPEGERDGVLNVDEEKAAGGDFLKLRRIIYQALQQACMQGRLISKPPTFDYGWNVDLVPRANESYEKQMQAKRDEDAASGPDGDSGLAEHMSTGHKNFLRSAVYFLYVYNRKAEAAKWYDYMINLYPTSIPVPGLSLDEYCVSRVQEDAGETDHNQTKAVIGGLLRQAFLYAAIGEDDQFVGHKSLAIQLRNRFQKEIGISTNRVGLPPFEDLERQVLEDLFRPNSPYDPVLLEQLRLVLKLPDDYGKNLEPYPDPQQPVQGSEPEPAPAPDQN